MSYVLSGMRQWRKWTSVIIRDYGLPQVRVRNGKSWTCCKATQSSHSGFSTFNYFYSFFAVFLVEGVASCVAEKRFDNASVFCYIVFFMLYSFYFLSAVYLIITKIKNKNIYFCNIIGALFILLFFAVIVIYGLTVQRNNLWAGLIPLLPLFIYLFLHGICLIFSNHNTVFEILSIVLLIVFVINRVINYRNEKLTFELGVVHANLFLELAVMVFPFVLIHIAFILHFKQSENISKN